MTADDPQPDDEDRVPHGSEPPVARASLRRNLAQMTSSQLVTWTLATVTAIIVPRLLGPASIGQLALANSVWTVGGVTAGLGTAMYLQLSIARDQTHGLRLIAPTLVARTVGFTMVTVAVVGYVVIADLDRTVTVLVVIVGLRTLVTTWQDAFRASFMGLERMATVALLPAVFRALTLVATITVLVLEGGVVGVAAVGLGMAVLSLTAFIGRFRRLARVDWSLARSEAMTTARNGIPYLVVALAVATYGQIDVVVISTVAGSRDLGWYSTADTLFGSLIFPTTVIVSTVFPTLGRLFANDRKELDRFVERIFSALLIITVPIGVGAALVGPTVAELLYGDEFSGTATLMTIFGPATILTFGTTFLAAVALASERQRFVATLVFAAAALTIPLDLVLVPWATDRYDNGAIGGAVAFAITEALQFALVLTVITPHLVTWQRAGVVLRVLLAAAVMAAAVWPLRELFFVLPAAVGAAVYVGAVFAFRVLDEEQQATLTEVAGRIRRR